MEPIKLPNAPVIAQTGPLAYTLEFEPLYPGYGVTIGNALRRVLLSSLPGSAVTAVKIKFADHEFSTVPFVKEDVVQLILNIKQLTVKSFSPEPQRLRLQINRQGAVTAADIQETDQVKVINKDLYLATIDDAKGELDIEFVVEQGRGYVPVEAREQEKYELGMLAVDAIFTPVRAVYFQVSNVRVGQFTNFEKLSVTIETDGSLDGKEALDLASRILIEHLSLLLTPASSVDTEPVAEDAADDTEITDHQGEDVPTEAVGPPTQSDLDTLPLSARARNALEKAKILTVAELREKTNEEIEKLPGLGKKTASEIMILLGRE